MKKVILKISFVCAFLVLWGALWGASVGIDATVEKVAPQKPGGPGEYRSIFAGESLKVMALGFDHAVAELEWLKLIQYVAYCSDNSQPMDNLYAMFDAVTTLDPKFQFIYEFSWVFMMTYDVRPNEIRIKEGEQILRKGWRYNSDSYRIAQNLAFHLFYYEQKYADAANLYDEAFKLRPDFALYAQLAASLRAKAGDPSLALMGLKIQYNSTTDEKVKSSLEYQIKRVQAEVVAYNLDKAIAIYVKEKGACPNDLHDLIAAGYVRYIPLDGLGGSYQLNKQDCKSESTTIGRLSVYYPPDKKKKADK